MSVYRPDEIVFEHIRQSKFTMCVNMNQLVHFFLNHDASWISILGSVDGLNRVEKPTGGSWRYFPIWAAARRSESCDKEEQRFS